MNTSRIIVAGIGPGSPEDITPAVLQAVAQSDYVVGYHYYFQFIQSALSPSTTCVDTGMKKERERAEQAFQLAEAGHTVCVISSGDAGIYGMAPLIWEMKMQRGSQVEVEVLPGISAFQKAASILGAPIGHDTCIISLSDLLTPWPRIERRIRAAAEADFVTAIYNPRSHGRYWQLPRLKEIFLEERSADTPVGYVRQAGRDEQEAHVTTLGEFNPEDVDMFTIVIIGNSASLIHDGHLITPRGYYRQQDASAEAPSAGASIMSESFRTIRSEMRQPQRPASELWPLLHLIHTSADFAMEDLYFSTPDAASVLYQAVCEGRLRHIVTDSAMAASGIRKGALQRLGIEVHCFVSDPEIVETARREGITRSIAAMRHAATLYPDALYVVGNAPTALLEICTLVRRGQLSPAGIIAAPVGFVHVCESKYAVRTLQGIPIMGVEGRRGGSNLAATLVNSILTFDDAEALRPGRDLL